MKSILFLLIAAPALLLPMNVQAQAKPTGRPGQVFRLEAALRRPNSRRLGARRARPVRDR